LTIFHAPATNSNKPDIVGLMPILSGASNTQREIAAVLALLQSATEASDLTVCKQSVVFAIKRLKRHGERLEQTASKLGAKGGKKTAERGPDYFRQIAAMRKTRAGGRPKKAV
jgi:hypothetical protein